MDKSVRPPPFARGTHPAQLQQTSLEVKNHNYNIALRVNHVDCTDLIPVWSKFGHHFSQCRAWIMFCFDLCEDLDIFGCQDVMFPVGADARPQQDRMRISTHFDMLLRFMKAVIPELGKRPAQMVFLVFTNITELQRRISRMHSYGSLPQWLLECYHTANDSITDEKSRSELVECILQKLVEKISATMQPTWSPVCSMNMDLDDESTVKTTMRVIHEQVVAPPIR
jgi:hypothetical protein